MSAAALQGAHVQRRFGALDRLYGVAGAERIRASHVAVVGIGGVGSWAAEALARSGVGRLTLIDLDHVAESNINRQAHALDTTLGQAKVRAMAERIALIHPGCTVHCVDDFAGPQNWPRLLPEPASAVIDACDQLAAKIALAAWALQGSGVFISVGAAGGKQQAERVEVADLAQVSHDPLLAKLRYALRRHHGGARGDRPIGIPCVFSREAVAAPDPSCALEQTDGSLNCHGYGSSVAVTATFGMTAAGWVLRTLARPERRKNFL
ncbi:tRNA threonylcarbamoyladenosine dehydratase [Comamonas flocculans]|uniref:tRNA threonylcarbamoyladenosine dehydratase n=1 Tax=Comamonas flocculans TaxID=2597701 RepID=A0A5B8RX30_9BURK|nr:tRNA threonylcarbamoyladenosine dehydratase [Comamonas flocculans]QEA13633.1 tRNA threonylcarbamoyladenosine dehydratase [Comamonas flocculans]